MRVLSFCVVLAIALGSLSASARRPPRHAHTSKATGGNREQYGSVRTYTFIAGQGTAHAHHETMTSVTISCEADHRPLWFVTTHKHQSVEHFICVPLNAVVDAKAAEPCTSKDVECEVALTMRSLEGELLSPPTYEVGTLAHPLTAGPRCLALEELDPKLRVVFVGDTEDTERTSKLAPLPSRPGAINCQPRLVNGHYERTILFEGALKSVSTQ